MKVREIITLPPQTAEANFTYTQSSHFFSKDISSKYNYIVRKYFILYTGLSAKSTKSKRDCKTFDESKLERTELLKISIILKSEIIL